MVLLSIRAPALSLIVSVLSLLSEMLFLSAALSFNSTYDSYRLRRGDAINVRFHRFRVLIISLIAMVSFVTMEAIVGITSDPVLVPQTRYEDCFTSFINFTRGPRRRGNEEEEIILNRACVKFSENRLTIWSGNISRSTKEIVCSQKEPLYSLVPDNRTLIKRSSAVEDQRIQGVYSLAQWQNESNTLLLATDYGIYNEEAAAFETRFYDDSFFLSNAKLLAIAKRLTAMAETCLLEEMENRRLLFVDVKKQKCPFSTGNKQATEIPLSLLVLALIAWPSSLILFLASLYFRNLTFDVSNSLHWAKYARHDTHDITSKGPFLKALDGDEKCVRVYGYVHDDLELGMVRDAIKLSTRWIKGFIGCGGEERDVFAGDKLEP